jgi:hypothetical protein
MLINEEYEVRGWIDDRQGRKNSLKGEIRSVVDPDLVVAEADALFISIT